MRPLRLKLRAFGPYAEEQVVDFGPLAERQVFLIWGPTGAGKTSLLDAMCFALYGETSGGERDPRQMRSDFSPKAIETEVWFEFALGDVSYAVWRKPEQERPKKRGTGVTTASGDAALWRRDGGGADGEGTVLATQPRQVNEAVVELLGFDCPQFRQVVVLPQGKFRRLLLASSREREKILEALFQTELYRRIAEQLKSDAKDQENRLAQLHARRGVVLRQAEVESLAALGEARAAAVRKTGQLEVELAELTEREVVERERLERSQANQRLFAEQKSAAAAAAEIAARSGQMERRRGALELARRAAAVADVAALHGERARAWRRAHSAQQEAVAAEAAAAGAQQRAVAAAGAETAHDAERQQLERDLAQWSAWTDKVETLGAARRELGNRRDVVKTWLRRRGDGERRFEKCKQAADRAAGALREVELAQGSALAARLVPGEPCPVCGSTEHPAPAAEGPQEGGDVARARQCAEDTAAKLAAAVAGLRDIEVSHGRAEQSVAEQAQLVQQSEGELPEDMRDSAALAAAIAAAEKRLQDLTSASQAAHQEVVRCERDRVAVQHQLTERRQVAEAARDELDGASAVLEQRLRAAGFATAEEFAAARLDPAELAAADAEVRGFDTDARAAASRLERAEREIASLEPVNADAIAAALTALTSARDRAVRTRGRIEERLRMIDVWWRDLEAVETAIAGVEREFSSLARLAEVATGNNTPGQTFQRFVQAAMLDRVLSDASTRLLSMSRRRFTLRRARQRVDLRSSGGLDLEVVDSHTGTARPVSTLSGGESFLASLALALGLSDVVQQVSGGVRVDTVFIDEGFGSLDAEALDVALRTLVDMRGEGRMVGVISHVAEMRERITTRLEVTPSPAGSSVTVAT